MKTKIAIVSGIIFAAILFTVITSSFMFPGLTCPAGTIVKNDVCVIASTDYGKSTQEHYEIEITGMKDVYLVGEQYDFSYIISGYGYQCGSKKVSFPDQNGELTSIISSSSCIANVPMEEFVIDAQKEYDTTSVHGKIKNPGTYTVTVTFDRPSQDFPTTASQEFQVVDYIPEDDIFTEPMKNAVFDKGLGHYDYLSINYNPNMMAMEKIELQDDDSINIEFGQNNYEWSTGYKPIPEFEYSANFKVNDTFVILCTNIGKDGYADAHPDLSKPYLPGLGIVKYLGPITIENEPLLLFWHESASIQVDMPCSYPEMIHHSINLWQLQEHGLSTDSIENALGSDYLN